MAKGIAQFADVRVHECDARRQLVHLIAMRHIAAGERVESMAVERKLPTMERNCNVGAVCVQRGTKI